jgi:low affinity Fe/Cu permease
MPAWTFLFLLLGMLLTIALLIKWTGNRSVGLLFVAVAIAFCLGIFYLRSQTSAYHQQARQYAAMKAEVEQAQIAAQRSMAARKIENPRRGAIPDEDLIELAPRATEPDEELIAAEVATTQPIPPPPAAVDPFTLPDWVSTDEGWQADGNYYVVVSATGRSLDECWNQLFVHTIPMTVYQYAHREIGGGWPYPFVDRDLVKLLIADQHVAPFSAGSVRMDGSFDLHKLYVRLHFKPAVRERMLAYRAEVLKSSRVAYIAWLGVLSCGAVGVVFGYLKVDDLTAGIHTRKLRFAAGGLLVGVAFCSCLLLAYVVEVESYGGLFSAF